MSDLTPCPVCDDPMAPFDTAVVMDTHPADYHQCPTCGLVATRPTPWLEEAYTSAIHGADNGLLRRARRLSAITSAVIRAEGLQSGRFLDWAGGYGVFTQAMRDRGWDFWQYDEYAQPVFALDYRDQGEGRFDLITAFEVFEHLENPREELAGLARRTDRLLLTTETVPTPTPRVADWWYYMPEVGQHITFHTPDSLKILAQHLGYEVISNGANWHLFYRGTISWRTRLIFSSWLVRAGRSARRTRHELRQRITRPTPSSPQA